VRIYRGKAGIVEKIVLIGIVVFVMMAPFRYSEASRGVVFYYHNDHLNTPVKMSDEKGNVVWEIVDKHPFGEFEVKGKTVNLLDYGGVESWSYTVENPLRFPGQYNDYNYRSVIISGKKGPYYNYHRWYNPDTGRYMEVDPLSYGELSLSVCADFILVSSEILTEFGIYYSYAYSINNSVKFSDRSGLQGGSFSPIPWPFSWFYWCREQARIALNAGRSLYPFRPSETDFNNHMRHCWTSCILAQESRLCAFIAGWANEMTGVYDPKDVEANRKGRFCSTGSNCKVCCECVY